ncbi:MAG: hypothetical protein Q8Q09_09480 [Deltaproteobacteria bacterium]|nr:hypothetical protein [Deltaproteobacteria bacterium]
MQFTRFFAESLISLALASGLVACRKPAPAANPDAGTTMLVPQVLASAGSQTLREMDAPLAWLFLPQAPVTTGSSPDVLVAAHLPCGFRPMYGTVTRRGNTLGVRLRARFAGPGSPSPDRTTPCPTEPPTVQFISLNTVRLGELDVIDLAPHPPGAVPAPSPVHLSVSRDDHTALPSALRWVRGCTAQDDSTCPHGGVCGALRELPGKGVCVPPLDAFLVVQRPCPVDTVLFELDHPGPYPTAVAPPPGPLRACLSACRAGQCPAGLTCIPREGGPGACVRP